MHEFSIVFPKDLNSVGEEFKTAKIHISIATKLSSL